jgi:hypothetical protein
MGQINKKIKSMKANPQKNWKIDNLYKTLAFGRWLIAGFGQGLMKLLQRLRPRRASI